MPKTNIIGIVKKRLWQQGYRVVERAREVEGFDLLVEGKYRVQVRKEGRDAQGDPPEGVDCFAIVCFDLVKRASIVYSVGASKPLMKTREMFDLLVVKNDTHGKEKGSAKGKEA